MKRSLLLLRLCGLLFLCSSASIAEAKDCGGDVFVFLKQADGTLVYMEPTDSNTCAFPQYSVTLSTGDSVYLWQWIMGDCYGMPGGLWIHGVLPGDTADQSSPVINVAADGAMLAQNGSYFIEQYGSDFGASIQLFINAPQIPLPLDLLFTKSDIYNISHVIVGSVPAGDTCAGPCFNANLIEGQPVRMQPIHGGIAQAGGNVVVRYAPDGEPLSFDTPADTVPLIGFEGYQFSEDGLYLLSVVGPMVTETGYAYVRVTHFPSPRVDMSLIIEHSDGTSEEVASIDPSNYNSDLHVELAPGDSLRVDHQVITEPCISVRLQVRQAAGWGPPSYNDPIVLDTPSTSTGIHLVAPGSYYLQQVSTCGIPVSRTYLTINAPTPQLDLVVRIHDSDGTLHELFRSHAPTDPVPHLQANLETGSSVQVLYEKTGYCGSSQYFQIHMNAGPTDAITTDPYLNGAYSVQTSSFSGNGNYLVQLVGGSCYALQNVQLHVAHVSNIHLNFDQLQSDGTSFTLLNAIAGWPVAYADVELATGDSIQVKDIVNQAPCTGVVLKGYRSTGAEATTTDPLFLYQTLDASGLIFRETGALLFTVENTCGALTASAHLTVSEANSTGLANPTTADFNAFYANNQLLLDTEHSGLLEIRNVAGQLMRTEQVVKDARHLAIPFNGQANGVYIATLRNASRVDVKRFVVY